ncbi:MAG: hypothetical protein K5660_08560 [Paludibacteraceae bacterium]|nr:hypothetical protein [Paludibacteraceae bacterium]
MSSCADYMYALTIHDYYPLSLFTLFHSFFTIQSSLPPYFADSEPTVSRRSTDSQPLLNLNE